MTKSTKTYRFLDGPKLRVWGYCNLEAWALPLYVRAFKDFLNIHVGPFSISFDWGK